MFFSFGWKRWLAASSVFTATFFGGIFLSLQAQSPLHFESKWIQVNGHKVLAEIADSPKKRRQGLMGRSSLKTDRGMLFVFEKEEIQRFWMKNTLIDLSIGFFDKENKLVDVQVMVAESKESNLRVYESASPAKYALEMNKGWFAKKKLIRTRLNARKSTVKNDVYFTFLSTSPQTTGSQSKTRIAK